MGLTVCLTFFPIFRHVLPLCFPVLLVYLNQTVFTLPPFQFKRSPPLVVFLRNVLLNFLFDPNYLSLFRNGSYTEHGPRPLASRRVRPFFWLTLSLFSAEHLLCFPPPVTPFPHRAPAVLPRGSVAVPLG